MVYYKFGISYSQAYRRSSINSIILFQAPPGSRERPISSGNKMNRKMRRCRPRESSRQAMASAQLMECQIPRLTLLIRLPHTSSRLMRTRLLSSHLDQRQVRRSLIESFLSHFIHKYWSTIGSTEILKTKRLTQRNLKTRVNQPQMMVCKCTEPKMMNTKPIVTFHRNQTQRSPDWSPSSAERIRISWIWI